MNTVLFPGTFDPPTLGHQDIILRAARLAKKLIIGVAQNSRKSNFAFTTDERIALLKELTKEEKNIEVVQIEGLIVDFAKEHQIDCLIRGLRAFSDMETEFQMALVNKKIGNLETLFFMTEGKFSHISSTLIREIASCGHHLQDFVPAPIEERVRARLNSLT